MHRRAACETLIDELASVEESGTTWAPLANAEQNGTLGGMKAWKALDVPLAHSSPESSPVERLEA